VTDDDDASSLYYDCGDIVQMRIDMKRREVAYCVRRLHEICDIDNEDDDDGVAVEYDDRLFRTVLCGFDSDDVRVVVELDDNFGEMRLVLR